VVYAELMTVKHHPGVKPSYAVVVKSVVDLLKIFYRHALVFHDAVFVGTLEVVDYRTADILEILRFLYHDLYL